jgi:hypothetical protein
MNCYYHQDVVSIGVCRSCFRGLCGSCAKEVDSGLACENRCEEEANKVSAYLKQSMKSSDMYMRSYRYSNMSASMILPVFFVALGLIYLGMPWFYGEDWGMFNFAGYLFVLFGAALFIRGRKLRAILDNR